VSLAASYWPLRYACRVTWVSSNILSTASSINGTARSSDVTGSTFIGKSEELSLSGLPLEGGGAGLYSGGSSSSSIDDDSVLIAQQPKAVERNARKLSGGAEASSGTDIASGGLFAGSVLCGRGKGTTAGGAG